MRDRRTQASLGLFIGTVVYLVLVLRSAYGERNGVPNLAVTGGTLLVLICVTHCCCSCITSPARSSPTTSSTVSARELDANIARLLPEKDDGEQVTRRRAAAERQSRFCLRMAATCRRSTIDSIANAAAEADAVVTLDVRAGQHVITGAIAGTSRRPSAPPTRSARPSERAS